MLKGEYDGRVVECPDCGKTITIKYDTANCTVCGWCCTEMKIGELLGEEE